RLAGPNGQGQQLNFNDAQKDALEAFMRTLSGQNVYTDHKWSNPFNENDELEIITLSTSVAAYNPEMDIKVWPNPAADFVHLQLPDGEYTVKLFNLDGKLLQTREAQHLVKLNMPDL